jgi:mRNA interferase RelE/StbE
LNTVFSPQATKHLNKLNEPNKSRILKAIKKLEHKPPQGDIKTLAGKDGFRLRVGNYRVLFGIKDDIIIIADIAPRGQVYKGRY